MSAQAVGIDGQAVRSTGTGPAPSDAMLQRAKSEFLEMPGLRLTIRQAARLWALDACDCERLLDTLVEARFLSRTRDGAYVRGDVVGILQHQ